MTTWTKNLADKHTYLLSKSLSTNETYTLLVTGSPIGMKGEVYLGTDLFIGYLEESKLTFSLEQANDATFLTFYILSSDAEIKTIKLETGGNPTNYKPATAELLLPLNRDSYMSPAMTYQMNGNILNFDGENVKYVLDGKVVSQKGINLIRNGNFTNETIGWSASYAKGFVNDCFYTLKALGTFSRPYVRYTTDTQCGDIIYVKFNARTNNSLANSISFDVHGTTSGVINGLNRINLPDANTWYEIDDVVNTKTLSGNLRLEIYHSYIDSTTAKDKEMEISNVQLINLTQSYGAGNEPTIEYIQSHPEEFAWTPNPNDLIETVEIKNNLVGDLENLQGNDFEQHEDGVITYTNEAEEGSVVRVDIDGISDQPLRFRNATGEQVVITEHDQIDEDAIKKVEFQGNSVQLADKYREVSGTSVVIAPELHDKNVADKLVIGGNTTQYTESSNVVTDGLQMWLSGRNFSNSPATTVWKDLTGVNNGTASGFAFTSASGSDGSGGVLFDGVDDYLQNSNMVNNIKNMITIELIASTKRVTTAHNILLYLGNSPHYISFINHKPFLSLHIGGVQHTLDSGINAVKDESYHIVGTYDGNNMKIYVNGILRNTKNIPNGVLNYISTLTIGKVNTEYYHNGVIKSARIYNRALSDAEVLQNYNAGVAIPIPNIAMPQEVKHVNSGSKLMVHGKNFWSDSSFTLNSVQKNYSNDGYVKVPKNPCVFSSNTGITGGMFIKEYDSNKTLLRTVTLFFPYRYTANFDAVYVKTSFYYVTQQSSVLLQLEEGSTATAYEPFKGYQETTIPVTLKSIG